MSGKDVGVRIRVERDLRDSFQRACSACGVRASDVLRKFMQVFVEEHGSVNSSTNGTQDREYEGQTQTRDGSSGEDLS